MTKLLLLCLLDIIQIGDTIGKASSFFAMDIDFVTAPLNQGSAMLTKSRISARHCM